jgi:hypothetical protein
MLDILIDGIMDWLESRGFKEIGKVLNVSHLTNL